MPTFHRVLHCELIVGFSSHSLKCDLKGQYELTLHLPEVDARESRKKARERHTKPVILSAILVLLETAVMQHRWSTNCLVPSLFCCKSSVPNIVIMRLFHFQISSTHAFTCNVRILITYKCSTSLHLPRLPLPPLAVSC